MSDKTKDILIRTAKTFAQTFGAAAVYEVAAILTTGGDALTIWTATKPVLLAALAAALCAAWNTLSTYLKHDGGGDDHE